MPITTLTVTYNGQPLAGAEVCIGAFQEQFLTTNENGQITANLDDGFAIVAPVVVRHENFGLVMGSTLLIEAGEDVTLAIGVRPEGE